jgi:hypothetical protein
LFPPVTPGVIERFDHFVFMGYSSLFFRLQTHNKGSNFLVNAGNPIAIWVLGNKNI